MSTANISKTSAGIKRRSEHKYADTDAGKRLAMFAQQDAALMAAFNKIPQVDRLSLIRIAEGMAADYGDAIRENIARHFAQDRAYLTLVSEAH